MLKSQSTFTGPQLRGHVVRSDCVPHVRVQSEAHGHHGVILCHWSTHVNINIAIARRERSGFDPEMRIEVIIIITYYRYSRLN